MKHACDSQKAVARGQSLIEIVVAVGVVILLLTGLVAGTTGSLSSLFQSKRRAQAVKLAQEAFELVRSERDSDWETFFTRSGRSYCLDGNDNWSDGSSCPFTIDQAFARTVSFAWDDSNETMTVTVTISWYESKDEPRQSVYTTYLTRWK